MTAFFKKAAEKAKIVCRGGASIQILGRGDEVAVDLQLILIVQSELNVEILVILEERGLRRHHLRRVDRGAQGVLTVAGIIIQRGADGVEAVGVADVGEVEEHILRPGEFLVAADIVRHDDLRR